MGIKEKIKVVTSNIFSKEKRKAFFSRNWASLLSFGVVAVFMLIVMIVGKVAPFGTNAFTKVDSIHQYIPFMADYQSKLKNGGSFLYTWKVGGGSNFMSLLLYYLASPLNLILIFFSKEGTTAAFSILVAFKLAFSAWAFAYMLSRRKNKPENNYLMAAFGLLYALNNYMVGYSWNIMWLDPIMVLPLVILGYERMIRSKDIRLYVLSLFYVLYCNYYIAFIICIFLVLWFFATGHKNIKGFFIDGIRFGLSSILAAGLAAFSLITAYLAIMKTASAKFKLPKFEYYGRFIDQWKKAIFLTPYINADNFDGKINIYAGTIAVFGMILFMLSNRIALIERVRKGILMAILLLSFNTKMLNYIWHGFHDQYGIPNRFSIVFIFAELYISYVALAKLKQTDLWRIVTSIIISYVFLIIAIVKTDIGDYIPEKTVALVSFILITLYSAIVLVRKSGRFKSYITTAALSIVIAIEILTSAVLGLRKNDVASAGYYQKYTAEMEKAVNAVNIYSDAKGYGLVRSDMTSHLMLDEPTYNGMNSFGTFCSTVRGDMVDFANDAGFYTGANEYLFYGGNPFSNDILGMRFVYNRIGEYYGAEKFDECCYENEIVRVYENKDALPIAYGAGHDVIAWKEAEKSSTPGKKLNELARLMSGIDEAIFTLNGEDYQLDAEKCTVRLDKENSRLIYFKGASKDSVIKISYTVKHGGRCLANIRGGDIKKVTYLVNDVQKAADRYQSQFFDMGELEVGDKVTFQIQLSSYTKTEGSLGLYISKCNMDIEEKVIEKLKKNAMKVTSYKDGYVEGDINLDEDQILFTSIPYDEGWHIYSDGKEVNTVKVAEGLLGANIGEGKHHIVMKFKPQGLALGGIISIISWIIFIFMCIRHKKHTKKCTCYTSKLIDQKEII